MKIKKLISSALLVAVILTMVAGLIPVQSYAAYSSSVTEARLADAAVSAIVSEYEKADFENSREMFNYDKGNGYLDYSTNGEYTIYVNRYTGVMYYVNNATGEMLTSNSSKINGTSGGLLEDVTSQILIQYSSTTNTEKTETFYSSTWAAKKNQITVTKIKNGLRVSYAIGETAVRALAPIRITADDFEENILRPMMDTIRITVADLVGEENVEDFFSERYYDKEKIYNASTIHVSAVREYKKHIDNVLTKAKSDPSIDKAAIKDAQDMMSQIMLVVQMYRTKNPNNAQFDQATIESWGVGVALEGMPYYEASTKDYSYLAVRANVIKTLCPNYTFDMMYADEAKCDYIHEYEAKPVFRLSLEYTFAENGELLVRLPSNSIVFDETEYILHDISPLKYFGAGDFSNDGYFFLPDGSGSVVEFEDFRLGNIRFATPLDIYGTDYCYSEIKGAHRQQMTMPVYGLVSEVSDGGSLRKTGFFAILEEGASMAELNIDYKTAFMQGGAIYSTMTPYPSDIYDLSDTISVGESNSYTKVSESKYTGSYVTRYVLLSNSAKYDGVSYAPGYVGMAEYYRAYLERNGVISELDNISDDLPLYIEALGSLDVVEKILTFPVTVSKALTTFEDIETMYNELGDAKAKLLKKAEEYEALAEAEDDNMNLKAKYAEKAESYRALSEEIDNIDNINFKLTGFANGGMSATYPTRVKWERVVGGKRGFKQLLENASAHNTATSEFGIYPDFDFQYINNTALFDGVGKRNTVSRMVDNRYASKQTYLSVTGEFDTMFSMIVSADALDRLYNKFIKRYSKYDIETISVSTLGSDLNSNFDKKNPVSRDEAQGYVTSLLDRMANESNYSVMISKGNIYAVQYADHILDVATDSTYYRYSSYTIPFVGMILHGYVNYSGAALNYSGSPDYDLLRAIENGASPYYVLGYRNTDLLKEDEDLNTYYSVDYENWFDDIVKKYNDLNKAIGDIQDYIIADHRVLIGERVIDEKETLANLKLLKNEFVSKFDELLLKNIDVAHVAIRDGSLAGYTSVGINVSVDELINTAKELFLLSDEEAATVLDTAFRSDLEAVIASYEKDGYTTTQGQASTYYVTVDVDYDSRYEFVTDSEATDEDYVMTDYTVANDLIVMVTYKNKEGNTRTFILNYNIYAVEVNLGTLGTYKIDKYGFAVLGE